MSADAPRPDLHNAKKFIEAINGRTNGVPSFVLCLKPKQGGPEELGPDDDLFMKDGKARYPMIGMLNLGGSPSMSYVNRVMAFGINFVKEYQGILPASFRFYAEVVRRQGLRHRGSEVDA